MLAIGGDETGDNGYLGFDFLLGSCTLGLEVWIFGLDGSVFDLDVVVSLHDLPLLGARLVLDGHVAGRVGLGFLVGGQRRCYVLRRHGI